MRKVALITGITGQDGSYLAELLLEKGYKVHGMIRRTSYFNTSRVDLLNKYAKKSNKTFELHYGDLLDQSSIIHLLYKVRPDEIYNLAAQTHVQVSFSQPEFTTMANSVGVLHLLEAIRIVNDRIKFYQASTSEMYGKVQEVPQSETTPFYPRSPYGVSKLYGHWLTVNYREAYNIFACCGILFNHESPKRGETFVTRKITLGLAKYLKDRTHTIELGNLDAKRDWGYTGDYVECMWKMLQHKTADDYVVATGEMHTVREFATLAAKEAGIEIFWSRARDREMGFNVANRDPVFAVSDRYFRPAEVDQLQGNYSKAKKVLGWKPRTSFKELVKRMVHYDAHQD